MATGDVVGYVSKVTTNQYVARMATGQSLGFYSDVGKAKQAVMQLSPGGASRLLTWTRDDMHGSIESYTATQG